MASEASAQKFVHTLEHGKGRWWIAFILIVLVAAYQVVAFLFINPLNRQGGNQEMFRGISHAKGMEQAVISRELMRGNGFSTTVIKPAAINLVEVGKKQEGAFSVFLDPNGPTKGNIPDYYHAPLNPWINSLALSGVVKLSDRLKTRVNEQGTPDFWAMKTNEFIHPADRVIAAVAVLFFLGAVIVNYFTAKLLFDRRLAVMGVLLTLFCDHFWQFAATGLPQMLMLFLFSLAIFLYAKAIGAQGDGRAAWPWLLGVAGCFGLLILAHGLTAFLFVGLLIHAGIHFRPHGREAGIMLVLVLAMNAPWLVRNHELTGKWGGLGAITKQFQIRGTESQIMRTLSKAEEPTEPANFRGKLQQQTIQQFSGLIGHFGKNLLAPFFFLALLHNFKKRETRSIRWALALMWMPAVFGMSVFGFSDYDLLASLQSNDLHLLFIPFFVFYGLSLLLMMWSRLEVQGKDISRIPVFNRAFLTTIIGINSLPLLTSYTDPPRLGFVWPPYFPRVIAEFSDWYTEKDIICSDMPWATAWYADRKSLWLPLTMPDFNELNDFRFNSRITGLLFSPVTGFRGLLSDVGVGEFKEWRGFIMRDPRAAANFPLKAARPIFFLGSAHYLLFADRDRWTERNN